MSFSSTTARSQYTANGTGVDFTIDFPFQADGDVGVVTTTAGVDADQTVGVDVNITGEGTSGGGNCRFVTAPASGVLVTIFRRMDLNQTRDFRYNGSFPTPTVTGAADKAMQAAQQINEKLKRVRRVSVVNAELPELAVADRASTVDGWDASGAPVQYPVDVAVLPYAAPYTASTIAALKAIPTLLIATGTQAIVATFSTALDGGGGDFVFDSSSSATEVAGMIVAPTIGGGRWFRKFSGPINVLWTGSRGDKSTDDTAAIQVAINYAASLDLGIYVPRMCRIASSLKIDRAVDGAAFDSYFTISSKSKGGFYVTGAVNMFSATAAFSSSALSQMIRYSGINFESSDSSLAAYVLHDARYLRVEFNDCDFVKIKCINAPTVITQSIHFSRCNMRRWTGIFFNSAATSFDIKFSDHVLAEAGANFAYLGDAVGCSFEGSCIEGMSGYAFKYQLAYGLAIHGCYFEQNDVDIDGTKPVADITSRGISIKGNYFSHSPGGSYAPSSQYSIIWGQVSQADCSGNFFTTYGHNLAQGAKSMVSINDWAETSVSSISGYLVSPHNAPLFEARAASDQAVSNATFTKVTLGTEVFDTNGNFASDRFTPTVAGYYRVQGKINFGTNAGGISRAAIGIYKNGTEYLRLYDETLSVASNTVQSGEAIVQFNGTTDYVELWGYMTGSNLEFTFNAGQEASSLSGQFIRS